MRGDIYSLEVRSLVGFHLPSKRCTQKTAGLCCAFVMVFIERQKKKEKGTGVICSCTWKERAGCLDFFSVVDLFILDPYKLYVWLCLR